MFRVWLCIWIIVFQATGTAFGESQKQISDPAQELFSKAMEAYEEEEYSLSSKLGLQLGSIYGSARGWWIHGLSAQAAPHLYNNNQSRAEISFVLAAELDFAPAQYELALMHLTGETAAPDQVYAFNLLSASADQWPPSKYYLGKAYLDGLGTEKNEGEGFALIEEASEKGVPLAQYDMGIFYADGFMVEQNLSQAVSFYLAAAENGVLDAEFNLGWAYQHGVGVRKNLAKAVEWYGRAAARGDQEAESKLAAICSKKRTIIPLVLSSKVAGC